MRIIGLTGGIGSGKSTVLDILKNEYNAHILLADDIGRQAFDIGTNTYNQMIEVFGESILNEDKTLNRAEIARIIMSDREKLAKQNSIIHPYVIERIESELDMLKEKEQKGSLVAVESAILYEAQCDKLCDEVWAVVTPHNARIDRLGAARGYTTERTLSFMAHQMSDEEYISLADKVIYNRGTVSDLAATIRRLVMQMDI